MAIELRKVHWVKTQIYPNFGHYEIDPEPSVAEVQAWLEERGYTVIGPDGPNYEAVSAEMRNRRIDRYIEDPEIWDEAVAAIGDAALGRTNVDGASGSMSKDIDHGGDE